MADRRPIKKAHERFHVENFLDWFNLAHNSDFKVILEPDPPEAIIRSAQATSWVEVSTAFWNSAYAQDVFSYATPGEVHKSVANKVFAGPDKQFAYSFVDVVKKKLEKETYLPFLKEYGPGYLVVPIHYPLFTDSSVPYMKEAWQSSKINDFGCFLSIYFACQNNTGWQLHSWPAP